MTVPSTLTRVATVVEDRLTELFDTELDRWSRLTPDLVAPLEALQALVMSGGKRLRPAFCFWGFVGAGGDAHDARVVDTGAAFELLQAFALVHDDVMDGSSRRRGEETAHIRFAATHADQGWRGEGRRFGEGVATLIGDLAHVYADSLIRAAPSDVLAVWDELRIELNVGQYLDLLGSARGDTDLAGARRISRYKSGKYTIERPLHVGAALAGRFDDLSKPLSLYGDPLGEAFQLRDDILGAFGEERLTGKPVGDDLREGKPTPLLAVATAAASGSQSDVLALVGDPDMGEASVAAVQDVFRDTGALERIESDIEALTDEALTGLHKADITEPARNALVELAHFVARRSS